MVNIRGEAYELHTLYQEDIEPGALLYGRYVRKAYRILVEDDGEWIMRNMRHPRLVDIATTEWLLANCNRLEPVSE